MTEKRIDYPRTVLSAAGHKTAFQSGLYLVKSDNKIHIHAVNPKTNDVTTHLQIQIPFESISEVIQALQELL